MGGRDELPEPIVDYCRDAGLGEVAGWELLNGGMISTTRRVFTRNICLVVKQSHDAPPELYFREADGLRVLAHTGRLRTPRVLTVTSGFLFLEDLGMNVASHDYWETFGHAHALHHVEHTDARFGYGHDNFLGQLPQHNGWMDDGHAFFADRRLLRYLAEPLVVQTLSPGDQSGLEQLAKRLPELIPPQPAPLLHGDLWWANMLVGPDGELAVIDPAVYFGWAEAELSMAWGCGRVPETF